jgi:hypothetical protein
MAGAGGGDLRSDTVRGQALTSAARVQPGTPLTFKRLLELAPADRLREMKQAMDRDVALDRAAILDWRRRASGG